jgi:hypothetical protein
MNANNVGIGCLHERTRVEKLPPGHQHWGRVICESCHKQLCWRPFPSNAERRKRNKDNIQKLLDSGLLAEWEKGFCEGVSLNERLHPRLQALLDQMAAKYRKDIQNANSKANGATR